jgi:hypothetical protein
MFKTRSSTLLAAFGVVALGTTQASAQQVCRPALAFTQIQHSGMRLPELERTWTATLSVDASVCQTSSGSFEIVYRVERESGPAYEVRREYAWRPGSVKVAEKLWIDEAIGSYRIDAVAQCPCR